MSIVPDIIPISELRQDTAGVIRRLKSSRKPVFITQRGRASAVLVSAEDYERTQHEVEILKALAQGELEIERGDGADLDSVFAKADELLSSSLPYREVIVAPYRFFYRAKSDIVWIVSVWHDAQIPFELEE